jgi:hypothetical protein
MFLHGEAAGIDDYIIGLQKSSFFQDGMLIGDDSVHAFFFRVVEGPYTPAKAKLIDKAFFLGENI